MKRITLGYLFLLIVLLYLLGRGFTIGSGSMYTFHDSTQAARVLEFARDLRVGAIPPRLAQNMSFGLGYPVFNFYAPFAYWVTAGLHLSGLLVSQALQVSFALALLTSAIGMFLYLRTYFDDDASFIGAFLYGSSPFFAMEIFVRGNLAEMWFLASVPWALVCLEQCLKSDKRGWVVALSFTTMAVATSHNALSIVGVAVIVLYAFARQAHLKVYFGLAAGILLSSYFLVPAFFELSSTYASDVASGTKYIDHFVCIKQLWSSPWGFAGSGPGCIDGMSFMLGKAFLMTALLGGIAWLYNVTVSRNQENLRLFLFWGSVTALSLLMTVTISLPVWKIGESFLKLFQFPWRFLTISVIGLAFWASYAFSALVHGKVRMGIIGCCVVIVLLTQMKYFLPNPQGFIPTSQYESGYLGDDFVSNLIAYGIPEYVPRVAQYSAWQGLRDNKTIDTQDLIETLDGQPKQNKDGSYYDASIETTSKDFVINRFYSSAWEFELNGNPLTPKEFDSYGRPHIQSSALISRIHVHYSQTRVEKLANIISLLTIASLLFYLVYPLWKKSNH